MEGGDKAYEMISKLRTQSGSIYPMMVHKRQRPILGTYSAGRGQLEDGSEPEEGRIVRKACIESEVRNLSWKSLENACICLF